MRPRKKWTYVAAVGSVVPLLVCLPQGLAQAPVLSSPMEDTVSPQLIQPLNQTGMPSSGGRPGDAGYGRVMWSVQPAGAHTDAVSAQPSVQPQTSLPVAPKLPAFYSPAAGSLTSPASAWTAGGAAVTAAMPGSAAMSSQAPSYGPGSSFGAVTRILPPGTGASSNALASSAYTSLARQAMKAKALQANRPGTPLPAQDRTAVGDPQLLDSGATAMPGVPESPDAVAHIEGSGSHSSKTTSTQSQPSSDGEEDADASHPFVTGSSSRMEAFAPRGFQVLLVTSPTADGMVIRLIATADGLQIVLQTKNAINGSILGDQSGTSRRSGITTDGWWAWGAGAGSWTPINVMTNSTLMNFNDPGEELIDGLTPKSKLDKSAGSMDLGTSER